MPRKAKNGPQPQEHGRSTVGNTRAVAKSKYWQQLKSAGIVPERSYVYYTEEELRQLVDEYIINPGNRGNELDEETSPLDSIMAEFARAEESAYEETTLPEAKDLSPEKQTREPETVLPEAKDLATDAPSDEYLERLVEAVATLSQQSVDVPTSPEPSPPPVSTWGQYSPETLAKRLGVPFSDKASRRAGLTFNTHGPDDVLRVSSDGKVWYLDEVLKPAIPLPRMRRKVRYIDSGVKVVERRTPDGKLDESFEVAGDAHREAEIKVTLPSSQTGVYYDPRLPFRVHVYNGRTGFDYMDVIRFYGGKDLVPSTVSTIYVGSDLCFDLSKTKDAMERELRDTQLGRNRYV